MVNDRNGSLDKIRSEPGLHKLELGCGNRRMYSDSIGVDIMEESAADIVGEVFDVLAVIPENSIDLVYCKHFLEHIDDIEKFLCQVARILRVGGQLEVIVPHFSSPYYYSDPTHKTQFGLYTMCYFVPAGYYSRSVPTYTHELNFELVRVDLGFKSPRPFYVRYSLKRIFGLLVNSCRYLQEFWEEILCYLIPCYEIKYILRKN